MERNKYDQGDFSFLRLLTKIAYSKTSSLNLSYELRAGFSEIHGVEENWIRV